MLIQWVRSQSSDLVNETTGLTHMFSIKTTSSIPKQLLDKCMTGWGLSVLTLSDKLVLNGVESSEFIS